MPADHRGWADQRLGIDASHGVVAVLAIAVVATGEDLTAGGQQGGADLATVGLMELGACRRVDQHGCVHLDHAVVAELAVVVEAGGQQLVLTGDSQRVVLARRDRSDGVARQLVGQVHGDRLVSFDVGRIAQLPAEVPPPAPDDTGARQGKAVEALGRDGVGRPGRDVGDECRRRLVAGHSAADLTVGVPAPGVDVVVIPERKRVVVATGDGNRENPARKQWEELRDQLRAADGAVSDLAHVVVAPAQDPAPGGEGVAATLMGDHVDDRVSDRQGAEVDEVRHDSLEAVGLAQIAGDRTSPADDAVVVGDGQVVLEVAGVDLRHVDTLGQQDVGGDIAVGVRPVADAEANLETPGQQGAGPAGRAGRCRRRRHDRTEQRAHQGGSCHDARKPCAVAELPAAARRRSAHLRCPLVHAQGR